jgi:hypothetical protein
MFGNISMEVSILPISAGVPLLAKNRIHFTEHVENTGVRKTGKVTKNFSKVCCIPHRIDVQLLLCCYCEGRNADKVGIVFTTRRELF